MTTRGVMLAVLLLLALLCYAAGSIHGVMALVVAGVALELCFWWGVLPRRREGRS